MSEVQDVETFKGLGAHEALILGKIAINDDLGHPATILVALEEKGLIERYTDEAGFPPMTVTRWKVPVPVHMEWCEWCAAQEEAST